MEIKAELKKPYTEDEKTDFIFYYGQNCKQELPCSYEIRETEEALEAWGYTEEEIAEQERESIMHLSLTAADVERAIYKDKGIDFDDILKLVEEQGAGIDIKALKIEFKANNFYRGNQYVIAIGSLLGYTSDDLDYLFEHKEFPASDEE